VRAKANRRQTRSDWMNIERQRGISVVLTDVVAPAAGVDLTPDAKKDIESLHE